jgi:hypothetical protein
MRQQQQAAGQRKPTVNRAMWLALLGGQAIIALAIVMLVRARPSGPAPVGVEARSGRLGGVGGSPLSLLAEGEALRQRLDDWRRRALAGAVDAARVEVLAGGAAAEGGAGRALAGRAGGLLGGGGASRASSGCAPPSPQPPRTHTSIKQLCHVPGASRAPVPLCRCAAPPALRAGPSARPRATP